MEKKEFEFVLHPLQISILYLRDALKAILHTILYIRARGEVPIFYSNCTNLKRTSYMSCNDIEVDNYISAKIDEILQICEEQKFKFFDIDLIFFTENKTFFSLFALKKSLEKWILPVELSTLDWKENISEKHLEEAEGIVQKNIFLILNSANKYNSHMEVEGANETKGVSKIVGYPFEVGYRWKEIIGKFMELLDSNIKN